MKILNLFLLLVCCFSTIQSIVQLEDSTYEYGEIAKSSDGPVTYVFVVPNDKSYPIGVTVQPCFGTFNLEIKFNSTSMTTQKWDSTLREMGASYVSVAAGTEVSVIIKPIKNYNNNPSAAFNIMVSTDESNLVTPLIPIPPSDGAITIELEDSGKTGIITYGVTGNSNDSYTIYSATGDLPDGVFQFSSCGIKKFAKPVTNGKLEKLGNNKEKYTISGLDRSEPTGVTVLIQRKDGYSNVYNYGILNDPNASTSSKITLSFIFILSSIMFLLL